MTLLVGGRGGVGRVIIAGICHQFGKRRISGKFGHKEPVNSRCDRPRLPTEVNSKQHQLPHLCWAEANTDLG